MLRYTQIIDISGFPCYKNSNAVRLYYHLTIGRNADGFYMLGLRTVASELGISYAAVRHALGALIRDGLVATQKTTQKATQITAHPTTQISAHHTSHSATLLKVFNYNELRCLSDTQKPARNSSANNADNSAPSNADSNADNNALINNNNNNNNKITLTHAREILRLRFVDAIRILMFSDDHMDRIRDGFLLEMELKGKTWSSSDDVFSHFIDWARKHQRNFTAAAEEQADATAAKVQAHEAAEARKEARDAAIISMPVPNGMTMDAWLDLIRLAHTKNPAPMVTQMYTSYLKDLKASEKKIHALYRQIV